MSDVTGGDTVADAMARTIERDAKRIAALKLELAEAKAYTQRLRVTLADVLALIPDGEMKTFAAKVLAGEIGP